VNAQNVDKDTKENILIGIFVAVIAVLVLQVTGTIYFSSNPDVMNNPILPTAWQIPTLVGLGMIVVLGLASLAYERKTYVGTRVFGVIASAVTGIGLGLWWFEILPYLFP
jgi:uncharacterized membrane protein